MLFHKVDVAGLILLFFEMSGGFQPLPTNKLQPLMDAVTKKGPVVVSIDASGWNSYGGGVFAPWLSLVWVNSTGNINLLGLGDEFQHVPTSLSLVGPGGLQELPIFQGLFYFVLGLNFVVEWEVAE